MIKDDQFYSPKEIAEALRTSQVTISRLIRQEKLTAIRVGGQWRISGSELRKYIMRETRQALYPTETLLRREDQSRSA